jgi:putative ABC transport system permease protein
LTAYIDRAGADVWVSQEGVRTMHMSESALPASVVGQVRAVPGVEQAVPVLYTESMLEAKGNEYIVYVFGVSPDAPFGGPWRIVDGAATPGPGEVILDHAIATQAGLRVGDPVTVLGREMKIAGLTSGTSSLVSSVSFVGMDDFARVRGGSAVISFVLVKVQAGEAPAAVSARIAQSVSGVTVQTRQEFATAERNFVGDMSADIINIMNTAGFLTGLAVVVLTVYIATVARRREYGVLKAMGVRNGRLYQIVLFQALLTVAMGVVTALSITLALSAVIPRFNELMVLSVTMTSVLRVTVISVVIAGVAAVLPAKQLAGLEPVAVLRGSRS